jgi:hypothetical protein
MPSISQRLQFVKDFDLQKILSDLFGAQISSAPSAVTAVTPAAVAAVAAPAGGVGTAAGGWDTEANRNLAIATINTLRTDLIATRAEVAKLVTDITALKATVTNVATLTA